MGFDPENKRFTPSNHEMLPIQVAQLVGELTPGDVCFVANEEIWADRTPGRKTWINAYAFAYTDSQVIELGETDASIYARVMCVNEGLIVDFSHIDKYAWGEICQKMPRNAWPTEEDLARQRLKPLPVIHMMFNRQELELTEAILANSYNIVARAVDLQILLDAIEETDETDEDEVDTLDMIDDESEDEL
jgi:hypothetical protein